jgi:hypothetical protein
MKTTTPIETTVRYFSLIKYECLLITYHIYNNGVIRDFCVKLYMSKYFVHIFVIKFNDKQL